MHDIDRDMKPRAAVRHIIAFEGTKRSIVPGGGSQTKNASSLPRVPNRRFGFGSHLALRMSRSSSGYVDIVGMKDHRVKHLHEP